MKQFKLIRTTVACLALAATCGVVQAQPTNLLGNPGFEITTGATKWTNYDGTTDYWNNDADPNAINPKYGTNYYQNTGVENTGANSGVERAFEMVFDGGAYQISTNPVPLASGNQIILTWWAIGTTSPDSIGSALTATNDVSQLIYLLTAAHDNESANDAYSTCSKVFYVSNALPNAWVQYSIVYDVKPADVGRFPGVSFDTALVGPYNITNGWAAYDDFALWVVPAGTLPIILSEPISQTSPLGGTVGFSVSAVDATGYQWMAAAPGTPVGMVGPGGYTNLPESSPFSGTQTPTLTVTGVQTNNNMDIVVVVSNGSGSVTSAPPANLTCAAVVYLETFFMPTLPDQSITRVGWRNDITGPYYNRIFNSPGNGVGVPTNAVYSYNSAPNPEAFYGTVSTITGSPYPSGGATNKMPFPGVNLNVAQNVSFTVNVNTPSPWGNTAAFIAVQMNFGNWYVSTNIMHATSGLAFITDSCKFNASSNAWNQLTVSGTGSDSSTLVPTNGPPATSDLAGYITGIGLVVTRTTGATLQFNYYRVLAAIPPSKLPVISSPPFSTTNYTGNAATFSVAANSNGVTAGVFYQWQTNNTVGGTTWGNLSNAGQFSGVTSPTLTINNTASAANHRDYRVIVSDGFGSVTSGLPAGVQATLTVVDSAPIIVPGHDALIWPNGLNGFANSVVTNEVGNNDTPVFTGLFTGTQPITYSWQYSSSPSGPFTAIPGATSTNYALPDPQLINSGYYQLQAANNQPGSPVNSSAVQLTVLPYSTAAIHWFAPVKINPTPSTALTAAQILNPFGTYFEAAGFGASSTVTVTNGLTVFSFDNGSASAALTSTTGPLAAQYLGASTGDTNLDTVLGTCYEVFSGSTITLNNLIVGQLYTVQLFGMDDARGPYRQGNFYVPTDPGDVSASFQFIDNVYSVGYFMATATTQVISFGQALGGGYIAAAIVRTVSGTPSAPVIQRSGANAVLSWNMGLMLQATNAAGPWTTNTAATPPSYTVPATGNEFFRTKMP